jgi:DNA-binding transcriptional regulator YdaS (Cro superfamily)
MTTFDKIIIHFGGKSALAKRFKLTPWAVSKWANRIPAERCPDIEYMSHGKFRCEDMRPDINWAVLRSDQSYSLETALNLSKAS